MRRIQQTRLFSFQAIMLNIHHVNISRDNFPIIQLQIFS